MGKHIFGAALPAALLLTLATVLSGCDRIRASLGKPTSADLAVLRQAKEAREQAVRDSMAAAEAERERLAAEQAARDSAESAAPRRYYAVAGAFKGDEGVKIFADKLQENGFRVRVFDFKSGLKVVCTEGSDDLADVRKDMAALKRLKLAPSDPWVYDTKQKLHKEL